MLGDEMTHNRRGTSTEVKNNENSEPKTMFDDLSIELLEQILKRLTLDNNIRASVVCKRWHSVATSVRTLFYSPWLIYSSLKGDKYEFYDPIKHKTYSAEFPQLSKSIICYAKDGWLLIYKYKTQRLFFFNPFTRGMIKVPEIDKKSYFVAFSCAPTSSECVLFMVGYVSPLVVTISTCYPGSIQWTSTNYRNQIPLCVNSIQWSNVLFSNGLFYCLTFHGLLAMFDIANRSWTVLHVPIPKCPNKLHATNVFNGKLMFMIEQDGGIIAISQCSSENPMVFKLDQTLMEWKETMTLDAGTFFASLKMRNRAYFPIYGKQRMTIISFSLDNAKFPPKNSFPLYSEDLLDVNMWIDPPKDFSGFK